MDCGRCGTTALDSTRDGAQQQVVCERVTEETVKGRVKNIPSKLGANDRTHAVTIGVKRGIIELP
jgi:DNA-binding NarL/FixJ family response regulator